MSFTINANFLANTRLITQLIDGSKVVFSQGKFDGWCICHVQGQSGHAVRDVEVFLLMGKYTDQKRFRLYKDFLTIFDRVTNVLNYDVVTNITSISMGYPDPGEVEFILIFYMPGWWQRKIKQMPFLKNILNAWEFTRC
jgi:hypothetical protein